VGTGTCSSSILPRLPCLDTVSNGRACQHALQVFEPVQEEGEDGAFVPISTPVMP
jgi:hypothetical protein